MVTAEMSIVLRDSGISDVLSDACEVRRLYAGRSLSSLRCLNLIGPDSPDRFVWLPATKGNEASTHGECTRGSKKCAGTLAATLDDYRVLRRREGHAGDGEHLDSIYRPLCRLCGSQHRPAGERERES